MKKIISVLMIIAAVFLVFVQTQKAQEKIKDNFEEMTFEVELSKNNYLLQEPIFINFKLSNQTGTPKTIYRPEFIRESGLKVNFKGKISEFSHLSSYGGGGIRFPRTISHNESLADDEMLHSSLVGLFFPEPGEYQIQFVLRSSDGGIKTIESNVIDIEIKYPQGINKKAFNFLKKHEDYFGLSSWSFDGELGQSLLETFVGRYSESVYSELAVSSLAHIYLSKSELEKAQVEFEKIRFSNHKIIASDAKLALEKIERRKIDLRKQEQLK